MDLFPGFNFGCIDLGAGGFGGPCLQIGSWLTKTEAGGRLPYDIDWQAQLMSTTGNTDDGAVADNSHGQFSWKLLLS